MTTYPSLGDLHIRPVLRLRPFAPFRDPTPPLAALLLVGRAAAAARRLVHAAVEAAGLRRL